MKMHWKFFAHHGHHAETHGATAHVPPANQRTHQCNTCCTITSLGPTRPGAVQDAVPEQATRPRRRGDEMNNQRQALVTSRWTEAGKPACLQCTHTGHTSRPYIRPQNVSTASGAQLVATLAPCRIVLQLQVAGDRHSSCQNPHVRRKY